MRTIMHVDMDAYFASVEQQRDPALRGKPIAVVGSKTRTVILSPSYEARKFGVKTGMRLGEARRCCPQLVLVEASNHLYTEICAQLVEIYHTATDLVEVVSIDEAFLDVTGSLRIFGSAEAIARTIKKTVVEKHGITCSVGIAPNKLLAKLASDRKKPDGLFVIRPEEVSTLMETLPVQALCGIGNRLTAALDRLGIRTCGELGRFPVERLRQRFGVTGDHLHAMARGEDDSPVVPLEREPDPKSMGHSMTYDRDLTDREEMKHRLMQLSEMVARRLRKGGFRGQTISLTIRTQDFKTFSKQTTIGDPIDDGQELYRVAAQILDATDLAQPVRLFGVSVSHLSRDSGQPTLFGADEKKARVMKAMDRINERYGDFTLASATLLDRFHHKGVISPAWRPAGARRIEFGK